MVSATCNVPRSWILSKCALTNDPGRTRTCNLWFRRPTPYPLGHRALRIRTARQSQHHLLKCSAVVANRERSSSRVALGATDFSSTASLAQLAEHALRKRTVVSSIPTGGFLPAAHSGTRQPDHKKKGLLRELNPGPLAFEARVMPLDQAADARMIKAVPWRLETKMHNRRAAPGIEPGISRTLSENHATEPSSHLMVL